MDFDKIILDKHTFIKNIFSVLEKSTKETIVFVCDRDMNILTDINFLKNLEKTATEKSKKIIFINSQSFVKNILQKSGFSVFSKIPKDFAEKEPIFIREFLSDLDINNENIKIIKRKISKNKKNSVKIFSQKKFSNNRASIFFLILSMIFLVIFLLWYFSEHTFIKIKPNLSTISTVQNFLITSSETEILQENINLPIIYGEIREIIIEEDVIIPTSGKKYDITNSTGKLTVMNYSKEPKFFVPSRLKSQNGVIVRFKEKIIVPVGDDEAGALVVEVEADEYDEKGFPVGSRGNLEAGTELVFPGLLPESQEIYFAKMNKGPLIGGSTLTRYFVAEEDKDLAYQTVVETFREKAIAKITKDLQKEGNYYTFLPDDNLINMEVLDFQFPEDLIGKELKTITVKGKIKIKILVFDEFDIKKTIFERITTFLDDHQKIFDSDLAKLSYDLQDFSEEEEKTWAKISVHLESAKITDIESSSPEILQWKTDLKKNIAGKTKNEAESILINTPEIDEILSITISPFWKKSITNDYNKIYFSSKNI